VEAVWGRGVASRPGYAGRPGGRSHMAGAGWSEAGTSARGREGGELGRAAEQAKREAGRPSSARPLSLFFKFFS